jgi:hypothetical protein
MFEDFACASLMFAVFVMAMAFVAVAIGLFDE